MTREFRRTVDIAEAAGLALLGVVQSTGPVDSNVAFVAAETSGTLHASASADAAELEKAVENRTIISDIVFSLLLRERLHVLGGHLLEKVDVLVGVELRHLKEDGGLRTLRKVRVSDSEYYYR